MAWVVPDEAVIEISPAPLADLYLPDTYDGRLEARRLLADADGAFRVAFCSDYSRDPYEPRLCGHRDIRYFDGHQKCRRCPAGFMFECARGEIPDDELSDSAKDYYATVKAEGKRMDEAIEAMYG